jgi:hypothetical protein
MRHAAKRPCPTNLASFAPGVAPLHRFRATANEARLAVRLACSRGRHQSDPVSERAGSVVKTHLMGHQHLIAYFGRRLPAVGVRRRLLDRLLPSRLVTLQPPALSFVCSLSRGTPCSGGRRRVALFVRVNFSNRCRTHRAKWDWFDGVCRGKMVSFPWLWIMGPTIKLLESEFHCK